MRDPHATSAVGNPIPPEADVTGSAAEPGHALWFPPLEGELPHFDCEPYNEEPEPFTAVSRVDRLQVQTRGTTEHAQQGQLIAANEAFALSIAAKLRSVGRPDLSFKLEECHTQKTHRQCTGCHTVSTFWNRCDLFYCPRCLPRLARERCQGVEFWAKEVKQAKHVVLTVMNTMSLIPEHVKHLLNSYRRLRRNVFAKKKTFWWQHKITGETKRIKAWRESSATHVCMTSYPWIGGLFNVEVTNEGKGWHLHIHSLVDSRFIDARALAVVWEKCSRQTGHIVKVKDCRNKDYLAEVTKYAVKGNMLAEWDGNDIAAFFEAFDKFRTFGVFGDLYGKRGQWKEQLAELAEARQMCKCGCTQFKHYGESEWEWIQETRGGRPPPIIVPPTVPNNQLALL